MDEETLDEVAIGAQDEIPIREILLDQLDTLLAFLARPAVQRQLLVIAAILLFVWLLPELIRWWRRREHRQLIPTVLEQQLLWQRLVAVLYPLFSPIASLLLIYLAVFLFGQNGYPNGLLNAAASLFAVWLGFRIVLALLYARYGEAVQPYQRRVFTPILVIIILWQTLGNFFGISQLFSISLLRFSSVTVTLGNFLLALLVLYGFTVASWLLEQTLKHTLPSRLEAELGTVESVATLARYAVLAVGIVATLAVMGFDATSLAIVAGGLSVGIGIGLQEIVANFVSGLTLLFEQSLRPGDVIEIDGRINRVDKISLRATQVRTLDNTELIIPNATFTTAQVTSLTRGDRLIRVRLPFGVAYGSDPELVRQVATKTALQHELTLAEPPPVVLHRGFGDSALNFELGVWTNQPAQRERYRSDLYYRLQAALKEHKIEIPFPQRDLHIRSGGETVGAAQPDE